VRLPLLLIRALAQGSQTICADAALAAAGLHASAEIKQEIDDFIDAVMPPA
jgi:hypothetical protein